MGVCECARLCGCCGVCVRVSVGACGCVSVHRGVGEHVGVRCECVWACAWVCVREHARVHVGECVDVCGSACVRADV